MAPAILTSKLYRPLPRAGLVSRPRLAERLRRGATSRVTLVSAPAGFGKTTILADWLARWLAEPHETERCVAWLSLDPADREPASFWTYVVSALRSAVPGLGASALELLATSPLPTEPALTRLLNELAEIPSRVHLVLDDYHVVDGPEVAEGMTFLLEHLPPHVHVVISTRADPDLPLSRWRARGELAEVRAADLRFTPGEAAAYLNEVAGLDLASAQVAALEERTEGWIAALQLAALSIQGREDVGGFIDRFAGDDRYIVDYLVEEVLAHQPDAVRDFLLQSAVLDRLTGALCDEVTGETDGAAQLVALERANLFVVPLDDRRQWYRYHHLFADVLRARLRAEQPELVARLHQRASLWYERQELTAEAVGHALAARDFDRAAHLMEVAVPAIRRDRNEAMLAGWLTELPEAIARRSPVLSVFRGYRLMVAGDLDGVEAELDHAERALAAAADGSAPTWAPTDELRTLPATIAMYRASLAQARGDVAGTAQHAERALDLAGPTDHLARGGAAGFLGLAAWVQGDVPRALETFTEAVASLHAAGAIVDELSSTVILADMWMAAGRPSTARQLYERALHEAESHGATVSRATADLHVGLSEIDCEVDDLDSARRHLETAAVLGERSDMGESGYRWSVAMARVTQAQGHPQKAITLLDNAEQLYRPGFYPDVRPIAALRARVWITAGNLGQAADWARARSLSTDDHARYLGEFDHLTLVRLLIAQYRADPGASRLDQTAQLLDRLASAAEASGRAGSLLEIRMLQALVLDALGQRAQAVECVAGALAQAPEPAGYVRLFRDEGAPMVELLSAAHRPAPASGEALSGRELQVLRLLDSELTGPQIARELFVSHNTLRTHTKHIFTKLDVTSRRAAVSRARERGLL